MKIYIRSKEEVDDRSKLSQYVDRKQWKQISSKFEFYENWMSNVMH